MSFGSRLRDARKKKGLTQAQAAEKVGMDFTTISKYENDHSEPDNETLKSLASLHGVSTSYLLGTDDKFPHTRETPLEQAEFLRWVDENLEGSFFYDFDHSPDESKAQMMEDLRYLWEREKRHRASDKKES